MHNGNDRVGNIIGTWIVRNKIESQRACDANKYWNFIDKRHVRDCVSKRCDRILARNQYIKALRVAPVVKKMTANSFVQEAATVSREEFITPLKQVDSVIKNLNFN